MATPVLIGRAESRVPPHDLEAETSVLGAILLDQAAITHVLDFLHPEDFYRENNGHIYRAAQNLFREGEPVDNVTLAAELEKLGVLERVGGRAHLAMLQESVPTAANVEYYARIVKDRGYKRRLITAGGQVTALGYEDALDAEEAVNQAQSQVYSISDDRVGTGLERLYDLLKPAMDRIDAQMASGGGVIGIGSGFHDFDRMTNGFKPSDLIVIAGRPSMGKCCRATTLVDDPDTGERLTIEECVRRRTTRIFGVGGGGSIRVTEVADWVDSGWQECFRVQTRTGRSIEVTGHHPFLTVRGWQPLHDIVVGDQIAVARRLRCFGRDNGASLELVRSMAVMTAKGGSPQAVESARFPAFVWRWDRARLAQYVRTLVECQKAIDSRAERPRIGFNTTSRGLAEDMQHAFTRFGILSRLSRAADCWSVCVMDPESLAVYQREIGWTEEVVQMGGLAGDSLEGRRSDPESDAGPSSDWPLPRTLGPAANASPTAYASATSPPAVQAPEGARHPDLHWDEVVRIEPVGKHQVYDLTVPEGANFIAQDVVVHNTSFVLNVALHAAVEQKKPVAIFSLEMSKEQLVERMLCEQARIDAQRLHRGLLNDVEYERLAGALGPLGDAPVYIDDSPMLDDLTLRLKSRQARTREGIEMIVLDYLQLMHGRNRGDDGNRVQEVSAISRALKSIARELKVPVLAISQLSRAPEARPDKRPILSDLRESGSIEQDADIVTFLYRDDYYHREKSEKPGIAEVIVAKHRNGPTGTIELVFRKELTRFENLERRRPESGV